jgi:hypothetical protein
MAMIDGTAGRRSVVSAAFEETDLKQENDPAVIDEHSRPALRRQSIVAEELQKWQGAPAIPPIARRQEPARTVSQFALHSKEALPDPKPGLTNYLREEWHRSAPDDHDPTASQLQRSQHDEFASADEINKADRTVRANGTVPQFIAGSDHRANGHDAPIIARDHLGGPRFPNKGASSLQTQIPGIHASLDALTRINGSASDSGQVASFDTVENRRPGPLGLDRPELAASNSERSTDLTTAARPSPDLPKSDDFFNGQAGRILRRLDELPANPSVTSNVHAQARSSATPDPLYASWSALSGSERLVTPAPLLPSSGSFDESYSTDASPQGFGDRSSDSSSSLARIDELLQQIIGELRNQNRSFLPSSRQLNER